MYGIGHNWKCVLLINMIFCFTVSTLFYFVIDYTSLDFGPVVWFEWYAEILQISDRKLVCNAYQVILLQLIVFVSKCMNEICVCYNNDLLGHSSKYFVFYWYYLTDRHNYSHQNTWLSFFLICLSPSNIRLIRFAWK